MTRLTAARKAFVVKIDGIDGCGKTTLIESLYHTYSSIFKVLVTNEFGSDLDILASTIGDGESSVSRVLNRLAKCPDCEIDDIERELLWAIASRRVNRIVIPRKAELFDLVLVDRSNWGNLAYGLVLDSALKPVFDLVTTPLETADLIFWLDTPVDVCQERLASRKRRDVIESKGADFFQKVREQYSVLYSGAGGKGIRLEGTKSIEVLMSEAIAVINKEGGFNFAE